MDIFLGNLVLILGTRYRDEIDDINILGLLHKVGPLQASTATEPAEPLEALVGDYRGLIHRRPSVPFELNLEWP